MRVLVGFVFLSVVYAYPKFQDRIPNGANVQHPCESHLMWPGVGHFNAPGGGKRNPFGLAFKAERFRWTEHLCRQDSDQDGRTNGDELGDPECTWTPGATASRTANVSHPGICQPIDSEHCRALQGDDFKCDVYSCPGTQQPDVKALDLRFPRTKVPAKETTYICKIFEGFEDAHYHAVAFEPIEDNRKVLHHMLLFGCDGPDMHETDPHECGMTESACQEILGAWTIGMKGFCLPPDVGISFGKGYFSYFAIQIHWNNVESRDDFWDSSGLRIYYTPNLRPIEGGSVLTGQQNMHIPPMSEEITHVGRCEPSCTRHLMPHAINISSVILHMHYLGRKGSFQHFRNGSLLRTIAEDDYYFYESPNVYVIDPPVLFEPGDEWVTTCKYQSKYGFRKRNFTVYYGDSTQDEMCYTFFTYFPRIPKFKECNQIGDISVCQNWNQRGCNWRTMADHRINVLTNPALNSTCDIVNGVVCSSQCQNLLRPLLSDPCMQGTFGFFNRHTYFRQAFPHMERAIEACDRVMQQTTPGHTTPNPAQVIG